MLKKDLEETIKEKVSPLLEGMMEKHWGIKIPQLENDITDKLKSSKLDIYLPLDLPFKDAKKIFKRQFFKKEIWQHHGNISQLAKFLGLDRRSVHRVIKSLEIDIEELRRINVKNPQEDFVDQTIRSTLDEYKGLIQPQKMEGVYQEIPRLSKNIAKFLPHQHLTWKEAEREFEKQFLLNALKENKGSISKTAHKIGIRAETLHRKVRRLGLS